MEYPVLPLRRTTRQTLDVFYGYDHNDRIGQGAFYDMENLTSDCFPLLCPRGGRGILDTGGAVTGIIAKDSLCYTQGSRFVVNGYPVELGLSDAPKQLVSMGAYVIILPDRKWINTLDLTDFGSIDREFTTDSDVIFQPCTSAGESMAGAAVSAAEPADPKNGDLWLDTRSGTYLQYSEAVGWVAVENTRVKISAAGIGKAFCQYDGVTLSGIRVAALDGAHVIWDKGDDFLLVDGLIRGQLTQLASEGEVKVLRQMPKMDFVVEAGNRLWGCRYGIGENGQTVNEIYGSKLGDFKNWNCFMGISTDSWAASVGTDGPFTGAVTHLGYPLFFKEQVLHKVCISPTGAHSIQDIACRGVGRGCERSLALVNETLFYKSREGICVYDGSLPLEISQALGNARYTAAAGGAFGNKYYISLEGETGAHQLFVYDTARKLWHREDGFWGSAFCCCRGMLYAIAGESGQVFILAGAQESRETVQWMAETGPLGIASADRKYFSRLGLEVRLEQGAQMEVFARYDREKHWTPLCSLRGEGSFREPLKPRRCEHMRLKFTGRGMGKV